MSLDTATAIINGLVSQCVAEEAPEFIPGRNRRHFAETRMIFLLFAIMPRNNLSKAFFVVYD